MSCDSAHEITHITAGAEQTVVSQDANVTQLAFLGCNVAAAAANATLVLYDGTVAQGRIIASINVLANSGGDLVLPSWYVIKNGKINAVLSGTGAVAEVFWNQG
jgi:hypothetical protein